ncbi:MAG: alpha/beta hydrolase [Chloroflexi bacterium]|jgi:pimeloyl-ACP methyl ester carboxylesterase|nr:alpha/beta hydrolase [Chloroflexota bacterium]
MSFTERYVHTGKIALNVAEWDASSPEAPVLVLVHGYGSNWNTWGRVVDKLAAEFRLFAVDLRGMGRSGRYGEGSSRQTWADDMVDLIPRLSDGPVYLVGHSLGGWVTAAVAAQHSGLVSKAILVEPYSGANSEVRKQARQRPHEERGRRAQQIRDAATPNDLNQAVAKQYDGASEDSIRRISQMWFQMDPALEEGPISRSEDTETFDDMFSSIKCPTLMIAGAADKGGILSEKESERVIGLIPDSRLLTWPKVGHSPHIARNHDFIRATKRFWAE